MLVEVGVGVLDGNGPLFVPRIGLRHHAAVHHGAPVVTPQVDVDGGPVAVIANFFGIKHERAVYASAGNVGLQAGFRHDFAITIGQLFAELVDVGIVFAREHFAECCEAGGHRDWVGVVGAAMEDLVLRNKIHHGFAGAESCERQASANGFGKTDHVGSDTELFRRASPAKLRVGVDFVEVHRTAGFSDNFSGSL